MGTFRQFWKGVLMLSVFLLGGTQTARAQFLITTSSPSDGATGVSTALTLQLVFNEPVDTLASIPPGNDGFLGIAVYPDPGPPAGIRPSPDGLSVELDWTLAQDTRYLVLVTGARSTPGHPLDRPYGITFTTGTTLPSGIISGQVDSDDGEVDGAVVNLIPVNRSTAGTDAALLQPVAAAVVVGSDGAYTVRHVPEGTYVVAAAKDRDLDGDLLNLFVDPFSFYDGNQDQVADEVHVGVGTTQAGIAVHLASAMPRTAAAAWRFVRDLIEQAAPGVTLTRVGGEVSADGRSPAWFWTFQSPTANLGRAVVEVGEQFALFQIDPEPEAPPVPDHWVNSDRAVLVGNLMGGRAFVEGHEGVVITANLASLTHLPVGGGPDLWSVRYEARDTGASFVILVDALSGASVGGPSATPALFNAGAAQTAASAWASDATLVAVAAVSGLGVDAAGTALFWAYHFHAPSRNAVRVVTLAGGTVLAEDSLEAEAQAALTPLPDGWLDSIAATETAEAQSRGFRAAHPDAVVEAMLAKGLDLTNPDRAVWRFTYASAADGASLTVDVDALSGSIITGVEAAALPETPLLNQNYPNPFNPETRITYRVPQAGPVSLVVYNLLGQAVRRLFTGMQVAGTYEVRWDGTGEDGSRMASGLYLYTLRAAGQSLTRTMVLRK